MGKPEELRVDFREPLGGASRYSSIRVRLHASGRAVVVSVEEGQNGAFVALPPTDARHIAAGMIAMADYLDGKAVKR